MKLLRSTLYTDIAVRSIRGMQQNLGLCSSYVSSFDSRTRLSSPLSRENDISLLIDRRAVNCGLLRSGLLELSSPPRAPGTSAAVR